MISRLVRAHDQPGGRVMNFRPFFDTMPWCAQGRHQPKQIATISAYALAVAALEASAGRDDL